MSFTPIKVCKNFQVSTHTCMANIYSLLSNPAHIVLHTLLGEKQHDNWLNDYFLYKSAFLMNHLKLPGRITCSASIQQASWQIYLWWNPIGKMPVSFITRYFIGILVMGQVKILLYYWPLSLVAPRQKISLLWKLILNPEIGTRWTFYFYHWSDHIL
jgi:hypothetical protein